MESSSFIKEVKEYCGLSSINFEETVADESFTAYNMASNSYAARSFAHLIDSVIKNANPNKILYNFQEFEDLITIKIKVDI
jgi:hypothetical protein